MAISFVLLSCAPSSAMAAERAEPSVMHGVGQVVGGILWELPKAVLDGTMTGPPVVGTAMGVLGGTVRALQRTAAGLVEIASAFDPWSIKRKPAE